ncbi:MAG: extracellular solute-binding protein [Clostridia bacterium]|nr:extracellular solute-binding protein [Clostridia bacterium]
MKKRGIAALVAVLIAVFTAGAVGCGGDPAQRGKVQLTFHAVINENNQAVMTEVVNKFNAENDTYYVRLIPKTVGYSATIGGLLKSSTPPNIVQIDDRYYKNYINEGYLTPLDEYFTEKKDEAGNVVRPASALDLDDIWPTAIERLRYDPQTGYSGGDNPLYGLPAGIAPGVMFYNASALQAAKVNIVSVEETDAAAAGLLPKGFHVYDAKPAGAGDLTQKDGKYYVFNNRIPMSWDELIEISTLFTKSYTASSPTNYGFFNEWWFSFGWSVGGDCLEWDEEKNQYVMALGEETPNYLVTGSAGATVNGTAYAEGALLSYTDKHYVADVLAGKTSDETVAGYTAGEQPVLYALPSIRDAFTLFLQLSQKKSAAVTADKNGMALSPTPTIIGNKAKKDLLTSNEVAFVVENYTEAYNIGKGMAGLNKQWDIAPLYRYRELGADGNVKTVNGTKIEGRDATHSGTLSYAIPANSKSKDGAWAFIEYMAGPEAQATLMKANFYVPNQISLAESDAYQNMTDNYIAKNKAAVLDMTACSSVGDWSYLEKGDWVTIWSKLLNSDVRNGEMTLEQFFADECIAKTNEALKTYRAKKYNG